MSDARGSDRLADQSVDLPREQSQPPQHSTLWYPSYATRATLYSSYMNVLLIFVPIGIVAGALGWPDVAVFFLNCLAIIPLAPLIAFSTRQLSASVGLVFGGLLNATLSNAVEMIVRHPCLSLVLYSAFFV
jgi:Ca2+:H+ antiporter